GLHLHRQSTVRQPVLADSWAGARVLPTWRTTRPSRWRYARRICDEKIGAPWKLYWPVIFVAAIRSRPSTQIAIFAAAAFADLYSIVLGRPLRNWSRSILGPRSTISGCDRRRVGTRSGNGVCASLPRIALQEIFWMWARGSDSFF